MAYMRSYMNEKEMFCEHKPSSIPAIEVRIWMNTKLNGGRTDAFSAGYYPHLVVKGKETMWGIWVLAVTSSPQSDFVFAGDEARLICALTYYTPDFDYADLKRGASFEIREGIRVVGTGVVLSDFEW